VILFKLLPSVGLLLLGVLSLTGCGPRLPVVSNSGALVQDCASLAAAMPEGEIGSSKWPSSVQALDPVSVERRGDSIIVTTFQKTGDGLRGYLVNAKEEPTLEHFKLSSAYPGVYGFDFVP
jgi:hypothetical protein